MLKKTRLGSGRSLREVARALDVSPSFLSQIENGKSQPSVATLYSLAKLLNVQIDELFGAKSAAVKSQNAIRPGIKQQREKFASPIDAWKESASRISLVNPSNRSTLAMDSGVIWERLSATNEPEISFMEINYVPGAESIGNGALISHDGYEYGYALEGEIEITIGEGIYSLSKGQSIGFDSTIPHKFSNRGSENFRGIWFVHGCLAVTPKTAPKSSAPKAKVSARKIGKSI
jgi:transcriptional regulator with XRE-family HTH domain